MRRSIILLSIIMLAMLLWPYAGRADIGAIGNNVPAPQDDEQDQASPNRGDPDDEQEAPSSDNHRGRPDDEDRASPDDEDNAAPSDENQRDEDEEEEQAPPPNKGVQKMDFETPQVMKQSGKHPMAQGAALQPQLLFSISYDHPHVRFERELQEAIENNERYKPDAVYQVVSYIPSGSGVPQSQHGMDVAGNNLAFVAKKMQDFGVPTSRVQTATEMSGEAYNQEIRIFVY